jgi:predicted DCC family thiol-disulfide oxidoreductase YuxK
MSTEPDSHPVIVFDGVCVLCNGWVRFLLRHDRQKRYRFAAMQTESGRALLAGNGLDSADPASFLLVESGTAWRETDAIVRVISSLGGFWRLVAVVRLVPSPLRDWLYRVVARNRYRWFGRHDACVLPTPGHDDRFMH